jgi:glutamate synthase domain-containing protein 3
MKGKLLELDEILLSAADLRPDASILGGSVKQEFNLEGRLDNKLITLCQDVIDGKTQEVNIDLKIDNSQRAFGATLSYHIAMKYVDDGLPKPRRININLVGSAGQSFCAFLAAGIFVTLKGDANDYVCKGLSGGEVVIRPHEKVRHGNILLVKTCKISFLLFQRCTRIFSLRRTSSSATSPFTARPQGARSFAGWPQSGSACAIPGPPPSSRASATTAAST